MSFSEFAHCLSQNIGKMIIFLLLLYMGIKLYNYLSTKLLFVDQKCYLINHGNLRQVRWQRSYEVQRSYKVGKFSQILLI